MAKHKAPTEVTIVPTVERQGLGKWIEKYWLPAAALGVLVAGSILALQYADAKSLQSERESWDALDAAARADDPAALKEVVAKEGESVAAPWALASLAQSYEQRDQFQEAAAAFEELRKQHPESYLAETRFRFGADATPRTLAEQATREAQDWAKWKADHADLFRNPELPADAPKVTLRTDQGPIVVGLYQDRAPRHVENFLAHCREGYYDGTLFHRVVEGFMIQGGDPNTRDGDPSTWGQGGPETGVPKEETGLRHFEGVLAAAKSDPKGPSSGSQFYIMVAPDHTLDENYTVFGKVLDGMELAKTLSKGEIEAGTQDRPAHPVRILGTDVQ